jgi:hypothetical protein
MPLYSYEIGVVFTGTGTASTSAASTTITGSGAAFTTQFAAGYLITVAGETRVIASITNDNLMASTANFTTGSGGAQAYTGANTINLESLATPLDAPRSNFVDYSRVILLGDGTLRGAGWATGEWRWGYMSQAQRNQLRTFCTGASAAVYVRTRENDTSDAYQYYTATMIWPTDGEEKAHGKRLDFVAVFQNMVELSVS